MIFFVFLLILSSAQLAKCGTIEKVEFLVQVLLSDLDVIEMYHNYRDDNLDAYIYWPHDIVFVVSRANVRHKDYLKIGGTFRVKTCFFYGNPRDGLYYRQKKFYVLDEKSITMKALGEDDVAYFELKGNIKASTSSYLTMKYKSVDEIQMAIQPLYTNHKSYLEAYAETRPSTYLATWTNPTDSFMEFTTWSKETPMPLADGGVVAYLGQIKENTLRITGQKRVSRVVFNPSNQEIIIQDSKQSPIKNTKVIALGMSTVGFIAEVLEGKIKILSAEDVMSDEPLNAHVITIEDFLKKITVVEPQVCDSRAPDCENGRPKEGKFQIKGHVLIKKSNYRKGSNTDLDEECPFAIEYETEGLKFMFGTLIFVSTSRLCTDNDRLWPAGFKNAEYDPEEFVSLMYSKSVGEAS